MIVISTDMVVVCLGAKRDSQCHRFLSHTLIRKKVSDYKTSLLVVKMLTPFRV